MPYRLSVLSGERVPLMGQIMQFKNVYLWNNGRIANFTMLMYQFWPGIVRGGLSAFMLWAFLRTGLKYMGSESWVMACVWVCGFVLLMPWIDQIYVQDFQLNYLWAGTIGLVLSYMVIRGGAGMTACALMAVLTGVWQEAVGFPVMVGLGVLWLFYPAFRTRRTALVVVLLGLGLVYLYTAQGARLYRMTSLGAFSLRLDILLVYAVVPAVAAVVTLVRFERRGRVDAGELFMSVSALVSAMLMLYAKAGPRVGENPQVRYCMRADFCRGPGLVNMYICPFTDTEGVRRAWYVSDDSSVRGLLEPVPLKMY